MLNPPNEFATLLDVAQRTAGEQAQGLIEANLQVAPEIAEMPVKTIRGIEYPYRVRTSLPGGSFRRANEGVPTTKSRRDTVRVSCYLYDAQMRCDWAVANADEGGAANFLAEEAQGATRQGFLDLGRQFFDGTVVDGKGFPGLGEITDASMLIDAGGSAVGGCTSAYLAFAAEFNGLALILGQSGAINMPEQWRIQSVTAPINDGSGEVGQMTAYVNGMTFWIGLAAPLTTLVARIHSIDAANPITDLDIANAIALFPVAQRPNRLYMNPNCVSLLHASRMAAGIAVAVNIQDTKLSQTNIPRPTESNGIPITETDSITNTENPLP